MVYAPKKALLVYQSMAEESAIYVEAYDFDPSGKPINAHPLSMEESISLSHSLAQSGELSDSYLQSKGLLPEKVLYTQSGMEGFALWYTPAGSFHLNFIEALGIPCRKCAIPALVWKADKNHLEIYALKEKPGRPEPDSLLYHAPFFNIYDSGKVCMGTVKTRFSEGIYLEDFMAKWEDWFFGSYFSHEMSGHRPVSMNMVQLWKNLSGKARPFPEKVLKHTGLRLKNLL
jgi:PRTRC genetic system protein B